MKQVKNQKNLEALNSRLLNVKIPSDKRMIIGGSGTNGGKTGISYDNDMQFN